MNHTREEYLEVCQVCVKRDFDMKKGVICSLTNATANYTTAECLNFELDQNAVKERKQIVFERERDTKGTIVAGFISLGLGLSIISYAGQIQFGLVGDAKLFPSPERIINRFVRQIELHRTDIVASYIDDLVQPTMAS